MAWHDVMLKHVHRQVLPQKTCVSRRGTSCTQWTGNFLVRTLIFLVRKEITEASSPSATNSNVRRVFEGLLASDSQILNEACHWVAFDWSKRWCIGTARAERSIFFNTWWTHEISATYKDQRTIQSFVAYFANETWMDWIGKNAERDTHCFWTLQDGCCADRFGSNLHGITAVDHEHSVVFFGLSFFETTIEI